MNTPASHHRLRPSLTKPVVVPFLLHSHRHPQENNMKQHNLTPINLLSQQLPYSPHLSTQDIPSWGNSSVFKPESKSAQLTIFYGGQVIVFDDFPADKAKEIMSFAGKGISQSQNNYAFGFTHTHPSFPANMVTTPAASTSPFPFNVSIIPDSADNLVQQHHPQAPSRPVVCDFPLTRTASLYRFMEKRKHRLAARAPYQTSNAMTGPYKPAESMSWFALARHSPQDKSESCSSFV